MKYWYATWSPKLFLSGFLTSTLFVKGVTSAAFLALALTLFIFIEGVVGIIQEHRAHNRRVDEHNRRVAALRRAGEDQ